MEIDVKEKIAEQKRRKRQEAALALALVSPFLIVFVLFTLIPFIMGFVFSFMRYNPYLPDQNQFIGFQNYVNMFNPKNPISIDAIIRLRLFCCKIDNFMLIFS